MSHLLQAGKSHALNLGIGCVFSGREKWEENDQVLDEWKEIARL